MKVNQTYMMETFGLWWVGCSEWASNNGVRLLARGSSLSRKANTWDTHIIQGHCTWKALGCGPDGEIWRVKHWQTTPWKGQTLSTCGPALPWAITAAELCGWIHHSQNEMVRPCRFNVGPPSQTAAQHYTDMVSCPLLHVDHGTVNRAM